MSIQDVMATLARGLGFSSSAPKVDHDHTGPTVETPPTLPSFGMISPLYNLAKYTPAHRGRVGDKILPSVLQIHTTDTYPGGFDAIVRSWTTTPGAGNGAHFLIGRNADDGVVQFVSRFRNANHAGGPNCGGFRAPDGRVFHPNTVAVGVELDNAGRLVSKGSDWVHPDTKKKIPPADVFVDTAGHGWHRVTEYQMGELRKLKAALPLATLPAGTVVVHSGTYIENGVPWAGAKNPQYVGHCTTNPIQKTDPGPQVMAEINSWT